MNLFIIAIDQDIIAFGLLPFASDIHITVQLYVNLRYNITAPLCHLFAIWCTTCTSPVVVNNTNATVLSGDILYSAAAGLFSASTVLRDNITQSTDYSLSLMFNPFANHSFVYYAASVDFVGEYLKILHSNDDSAFIVTALKNNTEVRIAPNSNATINGRAVYYGEEYITTLDIGESVMVTSSEDLTGSRVTANKTISFYFGHYCATGSTDNCSVLIEQIPPFNSWRNSFILHTNVSGLIGNMFKLISSDIGASVSINCTSDGINYESNNYYLGFRQHLVLSITHHHCIVNSDENILIIQFKDSSQSPLDTFMTIIPAIDQFDDLYVFNTYDNYNSYVVVTVKASNPNVNPILYNEIQTNISWKLVYLNEDEYYYGVLLLNVGRHMLTFSGGDVKFGAIIYGSSGTDTYALPGGMKLDLATDLPSQGMFKSGIYTTSYLYTIFQLLHQFKMQY